MTDLLYLLTHNSHVTKFIVLKIKLLNFSFIAILFIQLDLTRNYSREKTYTNGRVGSIGPQRLETDSKGSVSHRTLILVSI